MSMRRWVTYILMGANWIIAIGCAIPLFLFWNFSYKLSQHEILANDFVGRMNLAIIAPVLAVVISSVLLFVYSFLLKKTLSDYAATMNPKLLLLIKSTSFISIINLIIPLVLAVTGLAIISNQQIDKNITFGLLIAATAASILIGLCVTGYTSYINFRISFNEEKRKALLEGYNPVLKMYEDKTNYKDEKTKEKYEKEKEQITDDTLATSGSFN